MKNERTEGGQPTILVIIGITGDLTTRKLLPAIAQIAAAGVLPAQFRIVGITRRDLSVQDVLKQVRLDELPDAHGAAASSFFEHNLELFKMDLENPASYDRLHEHMAHMRAD